jgi:hypothetical protein
MHDTDMTVTERMVQEINSLLTALGEAELTVLKLDEQGELEHLREVRQAYTARLMEKMPRYRPMRADVIPDMFLQALRKREAELVAKEAGQ